MPSHSILSILCFELTTFSTSWGICFSLEANLNRYNPALFGTFIGTVSEEEGTCLKSSGTLYVSKSISNATRPHQVTMVQPAVIGLDFERMREGVLELFIIPQHIYLRV